MANDQEPEEIRRQSPQYPSACPILTATVVQPSPQPQESSSNDCGVFATVTATVSKPLQP